VVLSVGFRHMLVAQVRSTLEAKSSVDVKASFEHLLGGMCDAVVYLHEDLTLQQPAPLLDALLLRSAGIGEGQNFADLLCEGDRDKLLSLVQQKAQGAHLPSTLHVRARDANNTQVPLQLFHAQYQDALEQRFHVIGVREAGEPLEQVPRSRHVQPSHHLPAPGHFASSSQGSIADVNSISETSLVDHHAETLPLAQEDEYDLGEVAIWVDVSEASLPTLRCTPEFLSTFHAASLRRGTTLSSWFERDVRRDVCRVMQDGFNELTNSIAEVDNSQIPLGTFHMLPPHLHVEADLYISVPEEPGEAADDAEMSVARLSFLRIRSRPRKCKGSVRRRRDRHAWEGPASRSALVSL